ncbi:hypothetical protein RhiTH_009452 [Rhizoctonia solani]
MTDNPEPKGKGISSCITGILRCSTRSTSDLTSIHAHDISSVYPSEQKITKKSKNNGFNDSIATYASDDSNKKPRKIKTNQSIIPAGSTQEAIADAVTNIESISNFSPTPSPTQAPCIASPKVPLVPTSPCAIMVVSSSQEDEKIKDAMAGFEQLPEHMLDNGSQAGTPRSVAMDLAEDSRPMLATPKTNRIRHVCRETPMHNLSWNPEDQYWLDRLKDGAYPCNNALQCALKYSQITAKVIRSIINNRVTQDKTPNKQNTTIKFLKDIAKISETKPSISLVDNMDMETNNKPNWDNSKPGKGWGQAQTHPQPPNPFIDFDPTTGRLATNPNPPSTLSTNNSVLNQILKKLEQLNNINTWLSRLKGSKLQAKPAQTSQPANIPKPTTATTNPTSVVTTS